MIRPRVPARRRHVHPDLIQAWPNDQRTSELGLARPGSAQASRLTLLEEKEFFIRKAIGWVLRETAKRRPELVADWLAPRVHRASGVTMREAVKPLPADVRERLLAGYQDKRPVAAHPTWSSPAHKIDL